MIKKLFLAVVTCLVGLFLTERAHALSYRKITDEEMKTMANRIIAIGKGGDDKEEMKDLLDLARRVRPIVELVDAKCPMPLKVANGTNVPVFNVAKPLLQRKLPDQPPFRLYEVVREPEEAAEPAAAQEVK